MALTSTGRNGASVSSKRRLFLLHSWFGFNLALIMSIVLFTGTIAVVSDEIDWLFRDEMRVTPGKEKVTWGAMERALREAAPDDALTIIWQGEADYFAYRASMITPEGKRYYLHVDPWTGEVTGATHALTVQRFFRDLHRFLLTPKIISFPIVCSMGLVLLLSLYTGLKTAGRLRTVAFRLRTTRGLRVFVGDFHRAAGLWSLWLLVLVAVTGLWYLAEFGVQIAGGSFEPPRKALNERRIEEFGPVIRTLDVDELVERAKATLVDWEPSAVFFPQRPGQALMVWGHGTDPLVRDRANRVSLDPVDGSIIQIARSTDSGAVAYLNDIADPLHFGDIAESLLIKLIWFVFGLALTSLSLTGVWLTYRRLKSSSLITAQLSTIPVLLMTMGFGTTYVLRYLDSGPQFKTETVAAGESGPYEFSLFHRRNLENNSRTLRLHIHHAEGVANVAAASVVFESGEQSNLRPVFYGPDTILEVELPDDAPDLDEGAQVVVADGAGAEYVAGWKKLEAPNSLHAMRPPTDVD